MQSSTGFFLCPYSHHPHMGSSLTLTFQDSWARKTSCVSSAVALKERITLLLKASRRAATCTIKFHPDFTQCLKVSGLPSPSSPASSIQSLGLFGSWQGGKTNNTLHTFTKSEIKTLGVRRRLVSVFIGILEDST